MRAFARLKLPRVPRIGDRKQIGSPLLPTQCDRYSIGALAPWVRPGRSGRILEADDGLAAQPAMAEFVQYLPGGVQAGGGPDARGDCPVGEHLRDRDQPLR
jgi:hypothetical protein